MTLEFSPAGDCSLFVYFPQRIDRTINRRVLALSRRLLNAGPPEVLEVIPAYSSALVRYDALQTDYEQVVALCRDHAAAGLDEDGGAGEARVYRLPVAYGGTHGPDLDDVAAMHGLTPEQVIERHAGVDYFIYCIGFTPGFPYMGGLDPRLATPRLETPRTRVPAGSVGIAGGQTGVYTVPSPGGWRLLGRTPVPLFSVHRDPPVVLAAGHYVRFVPVAEATYQEVADAVAKGAYEVEWEAHHG